MAVTLDYLVVEDAPPAAIITLNRPETLNALSTGLMTELTAELVRQAARPEVRAIVLKGSGARFFRRARPQGDDGSQPRRRARHLRRLQQADGDSAIGACSGDRRAARNRYRRRMSAGRDL